MPHPIEVPSVMSILTVRKLVPIRHELQVRRVRWITCTPFAAAAASVVLDNEPNIPPHRLIIGRSRFTPRQQHNIDRASRAISRGGKATISTFPANNVRIRPAR